MDTKNIKIDFECLVALTPKQWARVSDIIGSNLEQLAFEAERVYSSGKRAWAKDESSNKALSEIYGHLAEYFFALRDHMEGVNHGA